MILFCKIFVIFFLIGLPRAANADPAEVLVNVFLPDNSRVDGALRIDTKRRLTLTFTPPVIEDYEESLDFRNRDV